MPWRNQISGMFGVQDGLFARHQLDLSRAQAVLRDAINSGVSFQFYTDEIADWHLRNFPAMPLADHQSEMSRVGNLSNYFN